jgi:hypothetical protein
LYASVVWCRFFVALFLLGVAGCTGVPGEELATYREAFLEAKNAGDLLYNELGAAVGRAGGQPAKQDCSQQGTRAPKCFDPDIAAADGGGSSIPAIRARLLALETVALYNLAVVDLLDGKSGDAWRGRIEQLSGVAKDLIALTSVSAGPLPALLAGPAAGMLAGLVKRLDDLRTRQLAAQSIEANAPVIRELIALLIDDTRRMYDLYLKAQGKHAIELELAAGSNNATVQAEYAKITAYHQQLTAYVKLLEQTRESLDRLLDVMNSGAATAGDLRAVIREAVEIRLAAEAFWAVANKSR